MMRYENKEGCSYIKNIFTNLTKMLTVSVIMLDRG